MAWWTSPGRRCPVATVGLIAVLVTGCSSAPSGSAGASGRVVGVHRAAGRAADPRRGPGRHRTTSDRTRIFGVASFAGSIAQDAGFPRPSSQQFEKTSEDVSAEQLDRADADWIFYGVQPGAEDESVTANPTWASLSAVAAGHVVPVDDDM